MILLLLMLCSGVLLVWVSVRKEEPYDPYLRFHLLQEAEKAHQEMQVKWLRRGGGRF